ncbi:copper-transporting ATPase, partial [Pseudomonas aeruginosa]
SVGGEEIKPGALVSAAAAWEAEVLTVSLLLELAPERRVLGLFACGDSVMDGAAEGVEDMRGRDIHILLITGDDRGSAAVVA